MIKLADQISCRPTAQLKDVVAVKGGKRLPANTDFTLEPTQHPYIRVIDLIDGSVRLDELKYISVETFKQISQYRIYDTDVYISIAGSIGLTGTIPKDLSGANLTENAAKLVINSPDQLDKSFLAMYLNSQQGQIQITRLTSKTTQPKLALARIEQINIPLPPLSEQQAIAQVLNTVQNANQARRRELELERERKAALMQYLFTHGIRSEATKQTVIGEIPQSWDIAELGKIAKIERGKFTHRPRNDPDFYGGIIPFIQTGDVTSCDGYIKTYTQTLNGKGLSVSKIFPKGTLVITIAANIGFTGILGFDSAFPDSLIGISSSNPEAISNKYLNYYLSIQQLEMDRKAPRGTQKNINIEFLSPWPIIIPTIDEQKEIVTILDACNTKISALEQERDLLEELFHALLEELMTGRISTIPLIEKEPIP